MLNLKYWKKEVVDACNVQVKKTVNCTTDFLFKTTPFCFERKLLSFTSSLTDLKQFHIHTHQD